MRYFTQDTELVLQSDHRKNWLYRCHVRHRNDNGSFFITDLLPLREAVEIAEVFRAAIDAYWEELCDDEDDFENEVDPYVWGASGPITLCDDAILEGKRALEQHAKMKGLSRGA
jgi:hypothetical protein